MRTLVSVRAEHDHCLVPPVDPFRADGWRTRLAGGGATHLSSHARHPRPATSDKTEGSQALARPTASKRVSSPPVGNLPSASDVTDDPNHNSKPRSSSAHASSAAGALPLTVQKGGSGTGRHGAFERCRSRHPDVCIADLRLSLWQSSIALA